MNYYHRFPGHYIAKTLHLSMEEDGAYSRLLDWMYLNERPVPHADRYAIARAMKPSERKAVDKVLGQYFHRGSLVRDDGVTIGESYFNDRVTGEIEKNLPRIQAAKENGRNGGRPRKTETQEKPSGLENENPLGSVEKPRPKAPQTPNTKHQEILQASLQSENSQGLDTHRVRVCDPGPTAAGEACKAMRQAGLLTANPAHPELLALLEAGATAAMFAQAAGIAAGKGKGFGYALGVLRGQLADAAAPAKPGSGTPEARHQQNGHVAAEWLRDQSTPSDDPDGVPA